MKSIKYFINKRKVTLLGGVPGIGKQIFYLNLLIDSYADKNVVIIKNTGKKRQTIDRLNKILYADSERKNRFLNFNIYDNAFDILDIKNLITKHKNSDLVIIDRLDKITGVMEENIKEIRKVSIDYHLPILVLKDILICNDEFEDVKLDDLEMEYKTLDLFSGFILINRESYYEKRGSSNLVVTKIDNTDDHRDFTREFKFNSDYERLYIAEDIDELFVKEEGTFNNIAGYSEIKDELMLIKSWLDQKDIIKGKGIDIPKGILLYGPAGTGKSLFAREFTNLFPDATVLKIKMDNTFGRDEITEKFEYARSLNRFVIILMDEFEHIARIDERSLLTELDGLGGDNSNIFVIATCNDFADLNPALTRRGRLDYLIGIGNATYKDRINLLKFYFEKYGIEGEFDFDYLALITKGQNPVNIKAIANETRLRFGANPTLANIEEMIDKIEKRNREYYGDFEEHDRFYEAVHEVGHAVVAWQYQDLFKFYKATLEDNSLAGGICKVFPTNLMPGSSERSIADIEISIGGYLACLMLYNYKDKGAISDLERARHQSAALVNTYGYEGFEPLLNHDSRGVPTSPIKKRANEKKSEKILARCEKNVRKIIKNNKDGIIKLANMLVENKVITSDDLKTVLG